MATICPICKSKVGGFLKIEAMHPSGDSLEYCKSNGIPIPEGICQSCINKKIAEYQEKNNTIEYQKREEIKNTIEAHKKLTLSAASMPPDVDDLGFVSGYCFMGTGPLASFFSSWTDFFGSESNSYLEKVKMAEGFALDRLRMEAHTKGADAIYNVKVNVTEASSGHGMLMFTAYGSAAKRHLPEE